MGYEHYPAEKSTNPEFINALIKDLGDKSGVSDGYHTFGQLYDHRIELWIALCSVISISASHAGNFNIWRTRVMSNGYSEAGWFLLGVTMNDNRQISYHLPERKWDSCWFADQLASAPEFDGHTSADVLERLQSISKL